MAKMPKKKVLVIVGQTASGKSALAVRLAKKFGGEIISADSRQVYKGLDIGTGKITKKEMRGVPHHLLNIADPRKQFSASEFKRLAEENLRSIENRKKLGIVVGGTGFYIDALAGKISIPDVPPNKSLRKKLDKFNKEKLFQILNKKDPRRAKNIDRNNKVRLIRALEIIESLGKVPPVQSRALDKKFIYIGLKIQIEELRKKIKRRVKKMFKDGLLKEIKKSGLSEKRLRELGFEYYKPTEESVVKGSIDYAKRQMTWFKRNKKIKWFKPEEYKGIEKYVKMRLKGD